ncbi:sulfotransferase domain-containing protein [Patescibacteria group bacterium]
MSAKSKPKLLYISCYGRSGSTLLDNSLSVIDDFFSVGEASYFWTRGLKENYYCGCGKRFNECVFWKEVVKKAFSEIDNSTLDDMADILKPLSKHKLDILLKRNTARVNQAVEVLDKLYKTIANVSGSTVIVDSSKWPMYGELLSQLPSVEFYAIHLIRDPRAVSFSWMNRKKYEPFNDSDFYTPIYSSFRSSSEWMALNTVFNYLKRGSKKNIFLLRYEDFANDPKGEINNILNFLNKKKSKNPVQKGNHVVFGENHSLSGNPIRFVRGKVKIKLDEKWKREMGLMGKLTTTAITLPYLVHYGYLSRKKD